MNAYTQTMELSVERAQIEECVLSLFHPIIFYRTLGKVIYTSENKYSLGNVGYDDIDCNFFDLTYIRISSQRLQRMVAHEISLFSEALKSSDNPGRGQITLEFYEKKKAMWPFNQSTIPWELWNLQLQLVKVNNELERQQWRERVTEALSDKSIQIADTINNCNYLPNIPSFSKTDTFLDQSFDDITPYNFKIYFLNTYPSRSVGHTVRTLIKETFSV